MVPKDAPRSPRGAQDRAKGAQEDPRMDQREPKGSPKGAQREPKTTKRGQGGGPRASKNQKDDISKLLKNTTGVYRKNQHVEVHFGLSGFQLG